MEFENYREGLPPRERALYDLLQKSLAAALGDDQECAARLVYVAWKSADQLHPSDAPLVALREAIMNIPCEYDSSNHAERVGFKRGHEQARYAAAALVPHS